MWGTGVSTARAQRQLRASLEERISHHILPVALGSDVPSKGLPVSIPGAGQALGILQIPRIRLDAVVVNGVSAADLRKGPGHYLATSYPWEAGGAVAIAGHRTTYGHPFWSLDKLRAGDLVSLVTPYGTFRYRVTGTRDILPSERWVLRETAEPTLVLTTCTPRFSASRRLVVFAARIDAGG